jgi:hypothetical protein
MPFCSGVYFSHFSSPAVNNANTRILCGQNTQAQNWAPIRLTITDYGALAAGTSYYFRFPLITLPSGPGVPLTYKVKLLQYSNGNAFPNIVSEFNYENRVSATNSYNVHNEWASLTFSNNVVQSNMVVTFNYKPSNFNIFNTGFETIIKFKNNLIPALTSLTNLASLSTSGYNYQYYPTSICALTLKTSTATATVWP